MGDTSDGTAAGAAPGAGDGAAPAVAKYSWRAWIVAHWRGELPLSDAFWFNGVILNLVFEFLVWGLDLLIGDGPEWLGAVVTLPIVVFVVVVTPWQVVGVWRSARRFPGRELPDGRHVGRWLWAIAACLVTAMWAVVPLAVVAGIFNVVVEAFS